MTVQIKPDIKTSIGLFFHKIKENIQQTAVDMLKMILIATVILFVFIMCFTQSAVEFGYKIFFIAGMFADFKINPRIAVFVKTIACKVVIL